MFKKAYDVDRKLSSICLTPISSPLYLQKKNIHFTTLTIRKKKSEGNRTVAVSYRIVGLVCGNDTCDKKHRSHKNENTFSKDILSSLRTVVRPSDRIQLTAPYAGRRCRKLQRMRENKFAAWAMAISNVSELYIPRYVTLHHWKGVERYALALDRCIYIYIYVSVCS